MSTKHHSIEESGSDSILFAHRASEMLKNEQNQEAVIFCEEGVKRFPFYAEGHYILARCYQAINRNNEAIEEFERTLVYSPGHLKALKALAYLNYQNNQRVEGNELLHKMSLYDPLNQDLVKFLQKENLYSEAEPEEEKKPAKDETLLDFDASAEPEIKEDLAEKIAVDETEVIETDTTVAIDMELPPELDEQATVSPEPEDVPIHEEVEIPDEQEAVLELDIEEVPEPKEESVPEEIALEMEPVESEEIEHQAVVEPVFDNVVEELFTEDEPVVEIGSVQDGSSLELEDITGLTETPEEDKESFERNSISEHLDETKSFTKPLDLDQFDNTEDDFSTLIEGYFQKPGEEIPQEIEKEQQDPTEPEQPVEERSFLDTSVIFNEKRKEDLQGPEAVPLPDDVVEDMNKVADEIEQMDTQVTFNIEKNMEESAAAQLEPEREQKHEESEQSGKIKDVIERIEKSKLDESGVAKDRASAAALDDEEVNIDDILLNPSLLTPTFGEILIAQKKFDDAREVFMALAKREPENPRFQKKIDFLNKIVAMQK